MVSGVPHEEPGAQLARDIMRDLECEGLLPGSQNKTFGVELITHSLLEEAKRLKYDGWWHGSSKRVKIVVSITAGVLMFALLGMIAVLVLGPKGKAQAANSHVPPVLNQKQLDEVSKSVPQGKVITVPPTTGQPIPKSTQNTTELRSLPFLDSRIDYGALLKPGYHLTPPSGWMNDPNGMFQMPGGRVHVFYQWNPDGPYWSSPWWGHVVSDDLVKWKRLPPALQPDEWYDRDGVFSGSATLLLDGTPLMLYTGVMNFSQYGFYYQQQAAAVPADLSDPDLTHWVKAADNPLNMSTPPGGTHAQFRDPVTAWQVNPSEVAGLLAGLEARAAAAIRNPAAGGGAGGSAQAGNRAATGLPAQTVTGTGLPATKSPAAPEVQLPGTWMTAVGTLDDCVGSASLYLTNGSVDSWQFVGTLFSQLALDYNEYQQCMPAQGDRDAATDIIPPGSRGFGGHCDQFGPCRMWECPDFVSVTPSIQMFKFSDQARGRVPWAADFYVLGDSHLTNYTRALIQDGQDAYSGTLDGRPYTPTRLDYGLVYASKTFRLSEDPSRLLWMGWVYEDSTNCSEVCANGTDFIRLHQHWQGAQTLIREVTYSPETQSLLFNPIQELQDLRQLPALVDAQYTLDTWSAAKEGHGRASVVLLQGREAGVDPGGEQAGDRGSHGRQVEVVASFTFHQHLASHHKHKKHHKDEEQQLDAPVSIGLRIHTGNGTHTDVKLDGKITQQALTREMEESGQPVIPTITSLFMTVDRQNSGGVTPATSLGGTVPVPDGGRPAEGLKLSVFVDRSILEVYALSGAAVLTSRVYSTPTLFDQPELNVAGNEGLLGAWGYELLGAWPGGRIQASVQMFGLDNCWQEV